MNQLVAYNTGLNPFRNQYRLGPFNWDQDASIRKTFRFTESGHVNLRVALDVFNVFNNQGLNPPGTNGITDLNTSYARTDSSRGNARAASAWSSDV